MRVQKDDESTKLDPLSDPALAGLLNVEEQSEEDKEGEQYGHKDEKNNYKNLFHQADVLVCLCCEPKALHSHTTEGYPLQSLHSFCAHCAARVIARERGVACEQLESGTNTLEMLHSAKDTNPKLVYQLVLSNVAPLLTRPMLTSSITTYRWVKVLDVSRMKMVNDEFLELVGRLCSFLSILIVRSCTSLTDKGFRGLIAGAVAKSLTSIDASGCASGITGDGIAQVTSRCKSLAKLTLSNLPNVDFVCPRSDLGRELSQGESTAKRDLKAEGGAALSLCHLDVRGCGLFGSSALQRVLRNTRGNLTYLNISECALVDDSAISLIPKCAPCLEQFFARDVPLLSDLSLVRIMCSCLGLKVLDVRGCEAGAAVWEMADRLKGLKWSL